MEMPWTTSGRRPGPARASSSITSPAGGTSCCSLSRSTKPIGCRMISSRTCGASTPGTPGTDGGTLFSSAMHCGGQVTAGHAVPADRPSHARRQSHCHPADAQMAGTPGGRRPALQEGGYLPMSLDFDEISRRPSPVSRPVSIMLSSGHSVHLRAALDRGLSGCGTQARSSLAENLHCAKALPAPPTARAPPG